mmetsp:Transcript_25276/g.55608  ORF Transcript_25276/g.55608 Transcript_25276/m.55608 type:complete len:125 (+) Transcript_25276:51-425(+)
MSGLSCIKESPLLEAVEVYACADEVSLCLAMSLCVAGTARPSALVEQIEQLYPVLAAAAPLNSGTLRDFLEEFPGLFRIAPGPPGVGGVDHYIVTLPGRKVEDSKRDPVHSLSTCSTTCSLVED